jgi:hypothetical protein
MVSVMDGAMTALLVALVASTRISPAGLDEL